jgi:hypothetical protein
MKPRGSVIVAPGTRIPVHRGHQRGGQSGLGASPQWAAFNFGRSGCPTSSAHGVRDSRDRAEVGSEFRQNVVGPEVPNKKQSPG